MNYSAAIKKGRLKRGYSQSELASRAGVGLATLQNIEADRANPSMKTVSALLDVLEIGLQFVAADTKSDFDQLRALGLPLIGPEEGASKSRSSLLNQLRVVALSDFNARELKALAAWLQAMHDHYPSIWVEVPMNLKAWAKNQQVSPKLRRIALARLSQYL